MAIFTFTIEEISSSTASIEAETMEEALAIAKELASCDDLVTNYEQGGEGITNIDPKGREEKDPDDGTHLMQTPRDNAEENANKWQEWGENFGSSHCALEHDHEKGRCVPMEGKD